MTCVSSSSSWCRTTVPVSTSRRHPPNQIIHVKYKEGFTLEALYDPVWVEGTLVVESTENDIAKSSYSVVAEKVERYQQ